MLRPLPRNKVTDGVQNPNARTIISRANFCQKKIVFFLSSRYLTNHLSEKISSKSMLTCRNADLIPSVSHTDLGKYQAHLELSVDVNSATRSTLLIAVIVF